jgi:hypothetical protein
LQEAFNRSRGSLLATRMPSSLTWAVLAFGMVPMVSSFCDQGGRRPVPNLRTQAGHQGRSRHAGQDAAGERVFAEEVDMWRETPCPSGRMRPARRLGQEPGSARRRFRFGNGAVDAGEGADTMFMLGPDGVNADPRSEPI